MSMMRITIQPKAGADICEGNNSVERGFRSDFETGIIGNVLSPIILERDTGLPKALKALAKAGMRCIRRRENLSLKRPETGWAGSKNPAAIAPFA